MNKKIFLLLGILALLLAGCEAYMDAPYLSQPKIQAGPPEAFVRPLYIDYRPQRLAILPFKVPPQVTDVGYSLTEVFHQQLLEKRPFQDIVRVNEYASNMKDAQRLAKEKNAELFLLGEVPYFLDSGTMGKSGLQVNLRIVETKTGRVLWYLSDAIQTEPAPIYDLWVTETKPRPTASIYFLSEALATRMCANMVTTMQIELADASAAKAAATGVKPKPNSMCIIAPGAGDACAIGQ